MFRLKRAEQSFSCRTLNELVAKCIPTIEALENYSKTSFCVFSPLTRYIWKKKVAKEKEKKTPPPPPLFEVRKMFD